MLSFWCYCHDHATLKAIKHFKPKLMWKTIHHCRLQQWGKTYYLLGSCWNWFLHELAGKIMSTWMINYSASKQLHLFTVFPKTRITNSLNISDMVKCQAVCSSIFLLQDVHLCCHGALVCGLKSKWRDEEEWKHYVSNKILRHISFMQCDHGWTTKSKPFRGIMERILGYIAKRCRG